MTAVGNVQTTGALTEMEYLESSDSDTTVNNIFLQTTISHALISDRSGQENLHNVMFLFLILILIFYTFYMHCFILLGDIFR